MFIAILLFFVIIIAYSYIISLIFKMQSPSDIIKANKDNPQANSIFTKKYDQAKLSRNSSTFLLFGLIFGLALVVAGFKYHTTPKETKAEVQEIENIDFEVTPPPTQQIVTPPPPPPPPEVEVVEDEEVLEEEPEIADVETKETEVVEAPPPVMKEEVKYEEPQIFTIVEDMPYFPGCEKEKDKDKRKECTDKQMLQYLASVTYPEIAKESDITGKVYVSYVINEQGEVEDVTLMRGADKILNEAAINHVKKMPKMIPGKQRGKAVKVKFVAPFDFKLK